MKVYTGIRTPRGCVVLVTYDEGEDPVRKLDLRHDLRNHSPAGAEWGYGGSGPAQLALAIVADALGDDDAAIAIYQHFKFHVVGTWKEPTFSITVQEVHEELDKIRRSLRLDREARQRGER